MGRMKGRIETGGWGSAWAWYEFMKGVMGWGMGGGSLGRFVLGGAHKFF